MPLKVTMAAPREQCHGIVRRVAQVVQSQDGAYTCDPFTVLH